MPVHEARLLEGKVLAAKIQEEIKSFVLQAPTPVSLVALKAGADPASDWYIGQQEKMASRLGIRFEKIQLPGNQKAVTEKILELNLDSSCSGIFLAMPLPKEINPADCILKMEIIKDVEGVHPSTLGLIVFRQGQLIPPTAYAALLLIEHAVKEAGKNLKGLKATIVGQSPIVGRPLQLLLGERRVTTTVCNTGTTAADLEAAVANADIVVGCAGQPGIIKGTWIKEGAIVIDVGTTEVNGKLVGDVEFEEAKKRAAFITPVPGGVGPLTVTMLMQNLIHAYKWQKGL